MARRWTADVTSRFAGLVTLVALALGMLPLLAVAASADDADVVASEVAGSEFSAPDPATLMLRPLCSRDDLRRFAVTHEAGPATRFSVSVAGASDDQRLAIAVGETRHFWVDTAESDQVEITWPDGSAAATPVADPCVPDGGPAGAPPAAPARPPAPDAGEDPTSAPAGGPARPPRAQRRAEGERDGSARRAPGSSPSRDVALQAPSSAADEDAGAPGEQEAVVAEEAPRPQPSGEAVACPNGWVAVDRDNDGRVETTDRCEVVIETASGESPAGVSFTAAALVVTIVLLVASVGVGAVGRRST